MQETLKLFSGYSDVLITAISILAVLLSVIGAITSLRKNELGSLEVKGGPAENRQVEELILSVASTDSPVVPFETGQLGNL